MAVISKLNHSAHHQNCQLAIKPCKRNYNVPIVALSTTDMPKWIKHPAQYDLLLSEIPRYSILAHFEVLRGHQIMWDFYQTVAIKFFDILPVHPWKSLRECSKNDSEMIQNAEWVVLRADIVPFFAKIRPRSRRVIAKRLKDDFDFADIETIQVTPSRTFRPADPELDYPLHVRQMIYGPLGVPQVAPSA